MYILRRLNANEDGENILGYDLYSSALADILTEPALTMPITVGLYAKWGSGKSFLLGKLKDEMLSFTREWIVEPVSTYSLLLFVPISYNYLSGSKNLELVYFLPSSVYFSPYFPHVPETPKYSEGHLYHLSSA